MNRIKVANDYLISIGISADVQFETIQYLFFNHYRKQDADKVIEILTKHKIPYKLANSNIVNYTDDSSRLYISVWLDDVLVIRTDNLINKIYE